MKIYTKVYFLPECDVPSNYSKDRSNSAVFLVVILGYVNTMKTRKKKSDNVSMKGIDLHTQR